MQLEDFEKQRRDEWKSKESVPTIVGDLHVELSINDRDGPPDETMLKLASELAGLAQTHGERIIDAIYAHYCEAKKGINIEAFDELRGLTRDNVISQVESVDLCVSRDHDATRVYDAFIQVVPYWELEHNLFASSDKSVGEFWLRKRAKIVI